MGQGTGDASVRPQSSPEAGRIILRLRQSLPRYQSRYGVKSLGMFGSYVRGDQTPGSDLDLLVEFAQPPSLLEFLSFEHELSDALGVKVDLVMRDALKPVIGQQILREVVPV